jgi:hypothetical protein
MPGVCAILLIALPASVALPPATPLPFTIDLTVRAGKASKTAHAEILALGIKPGPRAVLDLKAGQAVAVHWTLRRGTGQAAVKNVLVHIFVVREQAVGQATVPALNKDVAVESALTMDFRPGEKTEGDVTFTPDGAGAYLLRLETIGAAAGAGGRECFAALDLNVR